MNLDDVMRQIEALPPQKRFELEQQVIAATKNMRFTPNPGTQVKALLSPADMLLFGGQAGGGKGFVITKPVLTPFGWKSIGKLKVGDALCATDGTVQKVLGVYPRGLQPMYRLTWDDGTVTECDEDHIWLAWKVSKSRKVANVRTGGEASARKWTTKELFEYYQRDSLRNRVAIPVISEPCRFNVAGQLKGPSNFIKRDLHPYILGIILGDGHIGKSGVRISKPDDDLYNRACNILGADLTREEDGSGFYINSEFVKQNLINLGLDGKISHNKFIPYIYLFGSVEERWELMRGLMDTDGWCEEDGDSYYCSVSKQLIEDVRHLARSLGAITHIREKDPTYTYNGEKLQGQKAYTLRIKMQNSSDMFCLQRKKDRCKEKVYQSMGLGLDSIEPIEKQETVCIAVSNANSLFIVEDFIVTHNTALGCGLAVDHHRRSLLLRRKYADLSALTDQAIVFNGGRTGFSQMPHPKLKTDDGRLIEFGACQYLGDEEAFQGQARDLYYFDEVTQFLEQQIRFIIGWNRPGPGVDPEQRCRVVFGSNPPTSSTGDFIIGMFRPWLDPTYHNPAKDGELRWCATDPDGRDFWVDGPEPFRFPGADKDVIPKSRTFVRSTLGDNPYLINSDYAATLDAMPEPFRSAYRDGNFMMTRQDDENQLIPSRWVQEAQVRWTEEGRKKSPMTAIGADVANGGADNNILGKWHGSWMDKMPVLMGRDAPESSDVAAFIVKHRRDGAEVGVDMGGGYGGGPKVVLEGSQIEVTSFKGSLACMEKDVSGQYGFVNLRTAAYWHLRDALDPDQSGGSAICLPPDQELLSDLTAATFDIVMHNQRLCVKMESKKDIKKRLGRSPDKGDACVIGWYLARKLLNREKRIAAGGRSIPRVNLGHANRKRTRR